MGRNTETSLSIDPVCACPQQRFPAPPGGPRAAPRPDEIYIISAVFWVGVSPLMGELLGLYVRGWLDLLDMENLMR